MNKLTVLAATLAASVVATAEITSDNIVGYQEVTIPTGYYIFTPTFKNVGSDIKKFDIKTLTPTLPSGVTVGQNQKVSIFVLDEGGNYGVAVYWYGKTSMWTKDGTSAISDGEIMIGEGNGIAINNTVKVNASGEEVAKGGTTTSINFLVSGEVDLVCQNIVPPGYMINGNSTPVAINLKDVTPRLPSSVAVGQNQKVSVFMLDSTGNYTAPILWYGKTSMWTKDGINEITTEEGEIAVGQGFAVQNNVKVNSDGSGVEVAKGGITTPIYLELPRPVNQN